MNLGALPELLLSWLKTQGNILLQPGKAEQVSPFKPGQDYQGSVLSQLPSGRHLVRVAGQDLDMNLPTSTRAGESVRLTFLNAGPRPTFLLNAPPVTPGQSVKLSAATQQVSALLRLAESGAARSVAPTLPTLVPPAATLGAGAARAAPVASQARIEAGVSPTAPTSRSLTPAVIPSVATASATATPAAPLLATNGMSIDSSPIGVTTRSVVASLAMLQTPAVSVPVYTGGAAGTSSSLPIDAVGGLRAALPANTSLDANPQVASPALSSGVLPERLAQTIKESGLFYESHLAKWANGDWPFEKLLAEPQNNLPRGALPSSVPELAGMSEESALMAGRQLQLLEGGPFQWLGQIWQGQWMRWQIEEQLERDGRGADPDQRQWQSEISMQLPNLGGVRARLGLTGSQLSLSLHADDTQAQRRMQQGLPELIARLQAVGLQPTCTVQAESDV